MQPLCVPAIAIVCALYPEAKSFIKYWKLKPVKSLGNWQVFQNDKIVLIISGTGKIASASAVSYLLSVNRYLQKIWNIGVAGSSKQKIGDIFVIDQICDQSGQRTFYPDILANFKIPAANLLTVDQLDLSPKEIDLIDMEGSGFFQSANSFLNSDQIALLKVVSDNNQQGQINPSEIEKLIKNKLELITSIVVAGIFEKSQESSFLNINSEINLLISKAHFTFSEKVQLKKILLDLKVQNKQKLKDVIKKIIQDLGLSKMNKKEKAHKILQTLRTELAKY